MTGEQTLANRRATPGPGNDTRLVSIDVTTGVSTDLKAGPGVKMNPSPLAADDVGYIRKDTEEAGIYYLSGRRGPHGPDLRRIMVPGWFSGRLSQAPDHGASPNGAENLQPQSELRIDPHRELAGVQPVGERNLW